MTASPRPTMGMTHDGGLPPSPPAEKATARKDQAGDSKARGLARQTVEPTP
jgi:hypothetical protein